jgi:hypothetical protein
MSVLDTLVKVDISLQSQSVAQESFSIPLIIGPTVPTSGVISAYTAPSELLDNGYTTSSPEYVYAVEMFEQEITPTQFYVGERLSAVKQVDTLAVNTVTISHAYSFILNGVLISYTAVFGNVQQDILDGLNAAIAAAFPTNDPVVAVRTGTGGSAIDTLTSSVFGQGVTYSAIDSLLTHVLLTPNYGIADDLNALMTLNDTWYGISLCSNQDYDIKQLAAAVEGVKKIFIAVSTDSDIPTNATDDLLSFLKGKSYNRTALMFSEIGNDGKESAWMGGQLPQTPGSNNWAYKTLVGISPDDLTSNGRSIVIGNPVGQVAGKNGNVYTTVGGVNITQMGVMVGGRYMDITIGVDWLESTLQTSIYQQLVNLVKIPYTNLGVSVLIQAVQEVISQGIVNGLIDGNRPISISSPKVEDVPFSQRANRVAPTISFSCFLAGAIDSVKVAGTLSV